MEDVKTMIDGINKAYNWVDNLNILRLVLAFLDLLVVGMAVRTHRDDIILGIFCCVMLIISSALISLFILEKNLRKRARKETETLRRNCVRLKLTIQSYFTLLSLFVSSPDKVTFLQGPKTDDGKNMIILIWQSGKIETREIGKEEATEIFEPMFK